MRAATQAPRAPSAAAALEGVREREVQRRALAGEQVVDDHLAQQRVAERVPALVVDHDDVAGHRVAQRVAQLARLHAARVGDELVVEPAAGGEEPQRLLRGLAEALDADHERVAQGRGQPAAPVEAGGEELLGEERVALAALEQAVDEVVRRRRAEDVLELLGQLVAVEAPQLDPPGAGRALELGEQRPQRVAAVQLVGAVGEDDEDGLAAEAAGEEGEERARRAVGPVDVLEREDDRTVLAEALEQREERLEEPALGRAALVVGATQAAGVSSRRASSGMQRRQLRARRGAQLVEDRRRRCARAAAARRRAARREARPRRAPRRPRR